MHFYFCISEKHCTHARILPDRFKIDLDDIKDLKDELEELIPLNGDLDKAIIDLSGEDIMEGLSTINDFLDKRYDPLDGDFDTSSREEIMQLLDSLEITTDHLMGDLSKGFEGVSQFLQSQVGNVVKTHEMSVWKILKPIFSHRLEHSSKTH